MPERRRRASAASGSAATIVHAFTDTSFFICLLVTDFSLLFIAFPTRRYARVDIPVILRSGGAEK